MATPFHKYLAVKDNYCLSYLGDNKINFLKLLKARDIIEKELKGIKIFIICNDMFQNLAHGKRNITIESKMSDFAGKLAYVRVVDDIEAILNESNILTPENF